MGLENLISDCTIFNYKSMLEDILKVVLKV